MKLYIVRHGETTQNKKRIAQGHFDAGLNRTGLRQAQAIARRLKSVRFDRIYASDLKRASRTAEVIAAFQSCGVKYVKALRERNLGRFQNRPVKEYYSYLEKTGKAGDIHVRLPGGGESIYSTHKRAIDFCEKVYRQHKHGTILFVTHGGIMKALLMYFKKQSVPNHDKHHAGGNTALSIIELNIDGKHKIRLENDINHLG